MPEPTVCSLEPSEEVSGLDNNSRFAVNKIVGFSITLIGLAITGGFIVKWVYRHEAVWGAQPLKRQINFDFAYNKVEIYPGIYPGMPLSQVKIPYQQTSQNCIVFRDHCFASLRSNYVYRVSSGVLCRNGHVISRTGENVQSIFSSIGYHHRIATTNIGSDLIYFTDGSRLGNVLRVETTGSQMDDLRVRSFSMGKSELAEGTL